jgi:hypothetical protein
VRADAGIGSGGIVSERHDDGTWMFWRATSFG